MARCRCPKGHPKERWLRLDYAGTGPRGYPQFGVWLDAYDYELGRLHHVSPCGKHDEMLGFREGKQGE